MKNLQTSAFKCSASRSLPAGSTAIVDLFESASVLDLESSGDVCVCSRKWKSKCGSKSATDSLRFYKQADLTSTTEVENLESAMPVK